MEEWELVRSGLVFLAFAALVMCIIKRNDRIKSMKYQTAVFICFLMNEVIGIDFTGEEPTILNYIFIVLATFISVYNIRRIREASETESKKK